ncbi:bifunctional phosphoribosyl-AMP cyclohydrolase/phosphoribosyl-ATP diphosphatase HisIE [bacterium]|nr:bifunctional phosphoribosyl-AMP cyclohydrolase/phosphoribosyl-ATP diphosphatase HisIE [bacterium]
MRINKEILERLNYNEEGLIPAIVQDISNGQVLMLAYMNKSSLQKTLQSGQTFFYSRSRKRLWRKGETSGHTQRVKEIIVDCDYDTLLVKVEQKGVACHTGNYSCFFRGLYDKSDNFSDFQKQEQDSDINILDELAGVLEERKKEYIPNSYVCSLMHSPENKMPKKIAEEAAEVIIAIKDKDKKQIIYEMADLWFHTLVALAYYDIPYQDILDELKKRRKKAISKQTGEA